MNNQLHDMRNAHSFPRTLSCVISLASLGVCGPAMADIADLAVAGPTGRSSIAIATSGYTYRNDYVSSNTGQRLGGELSDTRYATLSGIYAVSDRVSLSLDLPWNYRNHQEYSWQGVNQVNDNDGLGKAIAASAVLLDQKAAYGYRLVGLLGVSVQSGANTVRFMSLQPQYWFSEDLSLTASYMALHQANAPGIRSLAFNLLWRLTPELWIMPSLSLTSVDRSNSDEPYLNRTLGLSGTYRLDDNWTASVGYQKQNQADLTNVVFGVKNVNVQNHGFTASIRKFF